MCGASIRHPEDLRRRLERASERGLQRPDELTLHLSLTPRLLPRRPAYWWGGRQKDGAWSRR